MIPLDPHIDNLRRELDALLELLAEESAALAIGNADRLAELTDTRNRLADHIGGHWAELARRLDLPADIGLPALRARAFGGLPPSPAWQAMEQRVHEAARLNQVNARLIEEQMRRTQAAMQVLQSASSSRGLYGADGRVTDFFNVNRRIDSA
jgi:flagellar biosynthesis/type III secretory pathway chaperone